MHSCLILATSGSSHPSTAHVVRALSALLLLLLLAPARLVAEPLVFANNADHWPLGPFLEVLEDPTGELTLDDVRSGPHPWQRWHNDEVSLGISLSTWWFRLTIENGTGVDQTPLLEIAYPSLDFITIHALEDGNLVERIRMGDHYPFHQRPIDHHYFVAPMHWPAEAARTLYIQVKTSGVLQVPLTLWQPEAFREHDQVRHLVAGMYFGTMLIMLIYNLFVYFGIGERSYLAYVGLVFSLPIFVASLTGYSYQYFWPDLPEWNGKSIGFFLSLAIMFGVMFTHRFLDLSRDKWPAWVMRGLTGLYVLGFTMIVTALLVPYTLMLITVILGAVLTCICALILGLQGWWQGEAPARQYVLAWSALLIGGLVLAGNKLSLLPQNVFTDNAVQFGSSLLVALLSFALAERINRERRRRYRAQMDMLRHERQAREAKEEALSVQRQANRELEKKVAERTEELRRANATLQEMSATDGLTGLRNRRWFDQACHQEFARCIRYQHSIALLFLDIDHFKRFNDTYGHLIGDDALRTVAEVLKHAAARDTDLVARYGGEEFCVLLPETGLEGATAVAERIREEVAARPFLINGKATQLTVSAGVAALQPVSEDQLDQLIRQADEALYEAKGAGRNQVQQYTA